MHQKKFWQYCRPRRPLSRQSGESMKNYVSRRRRCWALLTQMDRVEKSWIGIDENAFLTKLRMLSTYNVHVFTFEKAANAKLVTTKRFVGFRRKANTPAMEIWKQVPITRTSILQKKKKRLQRRRGRNSRCVSST